MVLCLAALVSGCSHDYSALGSGTGGTGGCAVGDETCACFPNKTCQTGLTCASDLCVRLGGTGTGGSAGSGGSVGAGGSVGSGGNVGSGGTPGSGGSIGPGGSPGSGGSVGSGGSIGSGGTLGMAGAVGAGGAGGLGGAVGTGSGGSVGNGGVMGTGGLGPPANNQIGNGDFNSGTSAPWHVTSGSGSATTGVTTVVTNGQFCVSISSSYYSVAIGWPTTSSPVAVFQASTTYELYYQMSTTTALYTFSAKVGSAPGSTATLTHLITTGTQGEPVAGAGLQTFSFTFVPGSDPTAGLVFLLSSGANPTTVCIDNVALGTPN